jgi:hypothetical protein
LAAEHFGDTNVNSLTLSPEMSACIRRLIDEMQPVSSDIYGRACKEELDALPLHWRSLCLWAIRPDGVVLCVDYEPFRRPVEPEEDLTNVSTALYHGMKAYPELRELFDSVRPEGFQPCDKCGGKGVKTREDGTVDYCWECGVRGWIIASSQSP